MLLTFLVNVKAGLCVVSPYNIEVVSHEVSRWMRLPLIPEGLVILTCFHELTFSFMKASLNDSFPPEGEGRFSLQRCGTVFPTPKVGVSCIEPDSSRSTSPLGY